MTDGDLLAVLDRAGAATGSIEAGALLLAVPDCPGWTVATVVTHTGELHRWVASIVNDLALTPPSFRSDPVPDGAALLGYYAQGFQDLRAALVAADLDEPVWTWAGPRPARWWLRRMTHEMTIHAGDVQSAIDGREPVSAPVAVDGIDEFFDVFVAGHFDAAAFGGNGETMHLHATDASGEWLVRFDPSSVEVTRQHAKGDVAARATASDLFLYLWGRGDASAFETFGDRSLLDRFQSAARV
jgi:uncharacterized protein (TIGR03083 family)